MLREIKTGKEKNIGENETEQRQSKDNNKRKTTATNKKQDYKIVQLFFLRWESFTIRAARVACSKTSLTPS